MNIVPSSAGCGSNILYGMYGMKGAKPDAIAAILYQAFRGCAGKPSSYLFIFGDGVALGNGAALAQYILDNDLGTITASEVVLNPQHKESSHAGYQCWFWHLNIKNFTAWYDEQDKAAKKASAPAVKTTGVGVRLGGAVAEPYRPGAIPPVPPPPPQPRDIFGRFVGNNYWE